MRASITRNGRLVKPGENGHPDLLKALGSKARKSHEKHKDDPVRYPEGYHPAMARRLNRLHGLLAKVVPVPEEWMKKPSEEKEPEPGEGNSLIYLISLRPPGLAGPAYHGFMGDFLKEIEPYTEATDACILGHLIGAVGAYFGPGPQVHGGSEQPARFNTTIVGPTSTGRKGTGMVPVDLLMEQLDEDFWKEQKESGLSTGEGLIQKVADKKKKREDGSYEIIKVDKRVYVVEEEFSKVLTHTRREGNILSQVMREAYDSGNLGVLTRGNPLRANGAHVCITGHITPEELKKRLSELEMANGFANRFLWFLVKSDKQLPNAPPIPHRLIVKFAKRLNTICLFARKQKLVPKDKGAKAFWEEIYGSLREDRPGFAGALTARGSSIVLRLALLYALLDQSKKIGREHLESGLAVWQYSVDSVDLLFRDSSGSKLADTLYRLLGKGPMKTTEFHSHMNVTSTDLREALEQLEHNGRISRVRIEHKGAGRPAELWERVR